MIVLDVGIFRDSSNLPHHPTYNWRGECKGAISQFAIYQEFFPRFPSSVISIVIPVRVFLV